MRDLTAPLRELFGFDGFRAGQEQVLRAALDGRDTLALMPTGSGKSLTYQLAAMLRPEPTLVLSPLIALMKDQVDKLPPRVAEVATFVNSSLTAEDVAHRLGSVRDGRIRLLYAAPERLRQAAFVRTLTGIGIGLVVVDEVHCVSMWGHDFRPDYLFIRRALAELGDPALLGMTATATPDTVTDIAAALGRDPTVVRTTVARPNLRYDVEEAGNEEERSRALVRALRSAGGGAAIVYARSRRSTERLARLFGNHGFRAAAYHAGLEPDERTRVQEAFVTGELQVVTATTAFGMGIDKPDVRLVALANHPDSLESYVQMVGRAGRDGQRSDTLLLAGAADAASLRRFALGDVPHADDLRRVYRRLRDRGGRLRPDDLADAAGDHDPRVLVGMLEQAGLVARGFDDGGLLTLEIPPPPDDAVRRVDDLLLRYRRVAVARTERMIAFAASVRCRHAEVMEHFGEHLDEPCGACDICSPRAAARRPAAAARPLPDDVARAIVRAVECLTWPLGRRSLAAMLRGSVTAPRSARASASFGVLAAATDAEVSRWIRALESSGALFETVTGDGYRVLLAEADSPLPSLGEAATRDADPGCLERLRAWRRTRSRTDGVPAYVVLHDATLHELAASRPGTMAELGAVRGLGPAKLERYGPELLEVLAHAC
jgi:ATP-dependent DNA helicase RecQ